MPFPIKAFSRGQTWEMKVSLAGPTLLDILYAHEVPIRSSCIGKGVCRQCRVKVVKGTAPVSGADSKAFSATALQDGWRLSCQIRPKSQMEIEFPQVYQVGEHLEVLRPPVSDWWIAFDAGTTGLEMAAIDKSGEWCRVRGLNSQVIMGADVMTRLEYAQRLGVEPLHYRLVRQIKKLLETIKSEAGQYHFSDMGLVAGNSAMISFLHQWSIDSLAVFPFQPYSFEEAKTNLAGMGDWTSLPLLNSFVGGDLWAGLFFLWKKGEMSRPSWILLDVGTNSEIIFWTGAKLLISSTPAGPAFEGSNISIGMRAESGAIINPLYDPKEKAWTFDVVDEDVPRGICGSALIQAVGQALKANLINTEGEILDAKKISLNPDLGLNQDDIREFQLAKSAIRTGVELIMKEGAQRAERLILAGSFGEHLPIDSAIELGLLPNMKMEAIGNSSLKGTIAWGLASNEEKEEFAAWIDKVKTPVDLALKDEFQAMFIESMNLHP